MKSVFSEIMNIVRNKSLNIYKLTQKRLAAGFSLEINTSGMHWDDIFKVLTEKGEKRQRAKLTDSKGPLERDCSHAAAVKYQLRHLHYRGSFKSQQSICKT